MPSYAKEIGDRVRGDVVAPMAKGAAIGSEKLAEGSEAIAEAIAEGARKVADKTRHWADDVTGARRRRNLIWLALGLTVLGAVILLLIQSSDN